MYCVVLAMSGLYQADKGYVRCLRWLARFSPATICLALAFVFSGTIGAVAQNADPVADTTGPTGLFEGLVAERTHDGMTPINFAVEFKEPVVGFTADDINRDSWFLPADLDPTLIDPTISEFEQDSTNSLRYTFTLTPRREEDMGFDFLVTIPAGSLTDAAGNPNARIGGQYFTYSAPSANTPPVADAGADATVNAEGTIPLDGNGSTVDSRRTLTYSWTQTGGTGGTLADENTATPTFTAPTLTAGADDVIHTFTLTVTDSNSATSADTVEITVNAPPLAMVAGAAERTVKSGESVTLDGSGSSDSTGKLTYAWTRTGGTSISLTGETTDTLTFTADTLDPGAADVTHVFTLTVTDAGATDGVRLMGTTTVMVTVTSDFADPVARAVVTGGQTTVASGAVVMLDGSSSTTDRRRTITTHAWTGGTPGATAALTNADMAMATFTADTLDPGAPDVTHTFTLTVTDSAGEIATATVEITVTAPTFPALVAEAGTGGTVDHEAVVQLVGTGSTPTGNGRTVTYAWARTGGTGDSSVAPLDPAALLTSFTAETLTPGTAPVTHIFTLTVTDNRGSDAATDTVTFTVNAPGFTALVAEAGTGGTVDHEAVVQLVGTGSTPTGNGRTVTYAWARTGGTGDSSVAPLDPAALLTSFTAETLTPGTAPVTHIFTLTVTDNRGSDAATDTVTFTVTAPTFPALVAEAGTGGTVDHEAVVQLVGTGSTPTGNGRTVTYAWARTGGTGDSSVAPLDPAALLTSFTAETLTPGTAPVTHIFTLTVTDNRGSDAATDTVTFTVNAPGFTALVAEAGTGGTVDHEAVVQLVGTGSTPTGNGRTVTYAWARTGGTGDSSVAPLDPAALLTSFTAETLTPGTAPVTHIFTLTVTDNRGSDAATDTVTFTVTAPTFPALVAEAGTGGTVDHEAVVQLVGTGSTPTGNGRTVTYAWARTGGTGDSSVAPLDPAALLTSFTAETLTPGTAPVTHIFTLTVTDNRGSDAATDTVTFTVNAPGFTALVAEAGTGGTVDHEAVVQLVGTGSTPTGNGRTVTYAWARTGGTGDSSVAPDNPAALLTSFTAETLTPGTAPVTHIFTLTVTDNRGSDAATDTVTFTVNPPGFTALVAEAGTGGTVDHEAVVQLVGTGSTPTGNGRTVTYAWARTGGTGDSSVAPVNPAALLTSFTAETLTPGTTAVTHIFTLTVTDNRGSDAATDTVTFTVNPPGITALVAEAGTGGTVDHEAVVPLDGTGSTPTGNGRTVTYAWARTGGTGDSSVAPDNPAALLTSFTAETLNPGATAVTHIFTLTVTDDQSSAAATDTVTFTVTAPFAPLVAQAGTGGTVSHEAMVPLDGTGSTVSDSNRTVTYAWARTGGTGDNSVAPVNPAALSTSFMTETLNPGATAVTHIFTLTVTDNQGSAAVTDTVTFTVTAPFAPLVAQAGTGGSVDSAAVVTLDGTGSTLTGGGRDVTYLWTRTGGTGDSSVAPSNPAALQTSFTAETLNPGAPDVTHIFTLRVTDNQGSTAVTDTVTFTVTASAFGNLVAEAGTGGSVDHEAVVPLDGTGSTVSDSTRTVTYAWARTGGTGDSSVAPSNPAALQTSFTAETLNPGDTSVTHIFTLTVTDNQGSTQATDTVTFTVTAPAFGNLVAEAGTGGSVDSAAVVPLVGTGSTVSDSNRTVTYAWARTGGTGDNSVAPSNPAALQTSFTAEVLNPGDTSVTHIFTLTVTDNQGSTQATDTVTFTVTAPAFGNLVAEAGTGGSVDSAAVVPLDGTGSTVSDSNRTVTYAWARTGGTGDSSVAPVNPAALQTSFTAETLEPGDTSVTHIFTLTVSDNQGSAAVTDTVTITVTAPPVVSIESPNAGPDGTIQAAPGEVVTLVGSATEIDGTPFVSFLWRRTGGTGDPTDVVLIGANTATLTLMFTAETAQASFVANTPEPGDADVTHIFTLTVTDSDGASHTSDPVTVIVSAVAQVERARADDPIPRPVGQFLETRATSLINNQPGLSSFLELDGSTPGGGGAFTFQATDGRLALDGGFLHNGVWGKVSGSRASSESGDTKSVTKSVLGSFGVHRKYSEHFLAGAMLQFDLSDHDRAGQVGTTHTIDGTGWLVGPYFAARHDTRPVYFEGRLLYGQSDNDIRFIDPALGVRTGSFDTKRLLAQIRVEGEIAVSGGRNHGDDGGADGPRLRPYADARWIEDRAEAFTDNIGNRVPGQKVSIGQLELGSNVEIPIAVRTGAMTLTGGLGLVWSNTEGDYITSDSGGRGRGEIGFSYDLDDNLRIEFESFYDGIGSSRYEGYGLSLSAEMKF